MALNRLGFGITVTARDLASRVLQRLGKTYDDTSKGMARSMRRQEMAQRAVAAGGTLAGGAFLAVRGFRRAINEAGIYGTKIAEVSTLVDSALFPTSEIDRISRSMARFGQDAQVQASALYQVISAGYATIPAAENMLTASNRLAVAGVTDTLTAVDGLTGALNNFAAQGETTASISDQMFTAVRAGKTTIAELSEGMGRAAPFASQLGLSFGEFMAAVATGTQKNIKTTEVMSGLKAALQNILKTTPDATAAAAKYGLQFNLAGLQAKGFARFINEIVTKTKGNQQALTDLFGSVEGANLVFSIASEGGARFNDILHQMEASAGATELAMTKVEATFAHQSKVLDATLGNLRKLGGAALERLLAPLLRLANGVAGALERFVSALPPPVMTALTGMLAAFAGIAGTVGGVMLLKGALGLMGFSFTSLLATLGQLLIIVPVVSLLVGGLGIAAYAAYRAFSKNAGGIATSWQDMVARVKLAWQGAVALVRGEGFSRELRAELGKAENQGVLRFLAGFERFLERMRAWWAGLKKGFDAGIDALAGSSAMQRLLGTLRGLFGIFEEPGARNSQATLDAFGGAGERTGRRLAAMGEIALNAVNQLVELGGKLVGFLSTLTAGDIDAGINTAITSFGALYETLAAIGTALGWIIKAVRVVAGGFNVVGTAVGEGLGQVVTSFQTEMDRAQAENFRQQGNMALYRKFLTRTEQGEITQSQGYAGWAEARGDINRIFDKNDTFGLEHTRKGQENLRSERMTRVAALRQEEQVYLKAAQESADNPQRRAEMQLTLLEIRDEIKQLNSMNKRPLNIRNTMQVDGEALAMTGRAVQEREDDRSLDPLYLPGAAL